MLYQKNGGPPQALPPQDVDDGGRIWTDLANNPDGLAACGWTETPPKPSYDGSTQEVVWEGSWIVRDLPPVVEPPKRTIVPLAAWFLRFTNDEVAAYNLLQLQYDSLTPATYFLPENLPILSWGVFLTHFKKLTNDIDLGHHQVQTGIALFQALTGSLMSDDRVEELMTP